MNHSEAMKARWADPIRRAALLESRNTSQAYRERGPKIAEKARERWANPEFHARVSATLKRLHAGRIGSPHSTKVTIAGVQYPSIAEAVRQTGMSRCAVVKAHKEAQQ